MGSISVTIDGNAVPKQSFRFKKGKRSFQSPRVVAWQEIVGYSMRDAYKGEPLVCDLKLTLVFHLSHNRRVDCDNLSKGCLDGMRGILYVDDSQITELHIYKHQHERDACVTVLAEWPDSQPLQPALLAEASPPHPMPASRKARKAAP